MDTSPVECPPALRGVLFALGATALFVDIFLVDEKPCIKTRLAGVVRYFKRFEEWITHLPFKRFPTWHLTIISNWLENHLWKKHPDWIAFIVGYLITTALSMHSILAYGPDINVARFPMGITAEPIPSTAYALVYTVPAAALGGILCIIGRRLLLTHKGRGAGATYFSILLWKLLVIAFMFVAFMEGIMRGFIYLFHLGMPLKHPSTGVPVILHYLMSSVLYYGLCTANAFWVFGFFIYALQLTIIVWLTLLLSIFLSRAIRFIIGASDGGYFSGAVAALSGMMVTVLTVERDILLYHWSAYAAATYNWLFGFGT